MGEQHETREERGGNDGRFLFPAHGKPQAASVENVVSRARPNVPLTGG